TSTARRCRRRLLACFGKPRRIPRLLRASHASPARVGLERCRSWRRRRVSERTLCPHGVLQSLVLLPSAGAAHFDTQFSKNFVARWVNLLSHPVGESADSQMLEGEGSRKRLAPVGV